MSHAVLRVIEALADLGTDIQADGAPHNTGPDFGKASPFGLLVIVLLLIAVVFLVRSMNHQLRKVPKSFDTDELRPDRPAGRAAEKPADQASDDAPGRSPGDDRNGPAHAPDG